MQPHLVMDETGVILLAQQPTPTQVGSIRATVPAIDSSFSAVPAEAPILIIDSNFDSQRAAQAHGQDNPVTVQSAPDYIGTPGGKRAYAAFVIMGFALLVPWSAVRIVLNDTTPHRLAMI